MYYITVGKKKKQPRRHQPVAARAKDSPPDATKEQNHVVARDIIIQTSLPDATKKTKLNASNSEKQRRSGNSLAQKNPV